MGKKKSRKSVYKLYGIVAFSILIVAIVLYSKGGILTGGAVASSVEPISFLLPGESLFFEVKVAGVKDMTVTFSKEIKDSSVITKEVDKISWTFPSKVYSMFTVDTPDAKSLIQLIFGLKVKSSDLQNLGIEKGELKVYQNGKAIETVLTREEGEYLYYSAFTNSVGEFIIGK